MNGIRLTALLSVLLITLTVSNPSSASANWEWDKRAPHPEMTENRDGKLKPGEYEVISLNGSITRALCPYTCEMRGLPKEHCRTWNSIQDPSRCYVQDTRLPTRAINFGGAKEAVGE